MSNTPDKIPFFRSEPTFIPDFPSSFRRTQYSTAYDHQYLSESIDFYFQKNLSLLINIIRVPWYHQITIIDIVFMLSVCSFVMPDQ